MYSGMIYPWHICKILGMAIRWNAIVHYKYLPISLKDNPQPFYCILMDVYTEIFL